MGRVLLAAMPEEDARTLVERSDLSPRTPRSVTSPDEIMERVAEARRLGYALVDQEVEIGLQALAVPVFSASGKVVAALNAGVAAIQSVPEDLVSLYLPELMRVQEGLRRVVR